MKPSVGTSPMTAETYALLPEQGRRVELERGRLTSEPGPFPRHAQIQARLTHALMDHLELNPRGVVLTDAGFLLRRRPDTVRRPDVSFVRHERFDPDEASRAFFRGAPDLAVEILSPSNRPSEVHAKVAEYLAAGARLVWVIDPSRGVATAHRASLEPRAIPPDAALDGEDVLPGFSLPLPLLLAR